MAAGATLALAGLGIAAPALARVAGAWTLASKPPNPTAAFHQVLYAATLRT